ncbi:AMP-binding protein [Rhodovulum sp. 12E13]|uniref:AMP-binding protein n=1 Tax=Rhodovulum sp. 12E13 TaxID=2203891 RepID=UPI0013148000|nr:AMP-binding protein [Rhodovulum sp. 12E13]
MPAPPVPDDLPLVDRPGAAGHDDAARDGGSASGAPPGQACLGLDSLELLEAVADLDRRFALSRTGIEDHLLLCPTLAEWGALIAEHLRRCGPDLPVTFMTSGSQGAPRAVAHPASTLLAEADALIEVLAPGGTGGRVPDAPAASIGPSTPGRSSEGAAASEAPGRVLVLVPCHHIFGFLFGALVPARAGWPVIDLAGRAPGTLARTVRPGDLIVATPYLLSLALRAGAPIPAGCSAVVSGAAAAADVWADSARAGLGLTEIYGATETGGIGWRRAPDHPFDLLPHLSRAGNGVAGPCGTPLSLQDSLAWRGPRSFDLLGRVDRVVQVAGVNVSPDAVARHLAAREEVCEAAVRLDPVSGRLKAFIVPTDPALCATPGAIEPQLRAACADLPAPARPQRFDLGTALPTGPSGKPTDW